MSTITTISPSTTQNVTQPWKFLGSASSVSPVSVFDDGFTTTTVRTQDFNGTGYYIDEEGETVWSDFKTVVLACIATLVPLVIILIAIFGIRVLWMQYKTRKKEGDLEDDTFSTSSKRRALHSYLFNEKGFERTFVDVGVGTQEDSELCERAPASNSNRSNNINGSIITMTLKNNHLIVETEERNDLQKESRECTVRYSPSVRDGVFVVEVQQGAMRRSPSCEGPQPGIPSAKPGALSNECALVHNPAERYSDEDTLGECDDSEFTSPKFQSLELEAKTGLSSSNTSLGSLQPSYCYSSQHSYDQGSYGYNVYLGYESECTSLGRVKEDTKPKITSALYKTNPKPVKSMSLDVANGNERLKVLGQNSSLDNVLESNGLEDFSASLYKNKVNRKSSELTVDVGEMADE